MVCLGDLMGVASIDLKTRFWKPAVKPYTVKIMPKRRAAGPKCDGPSVVVLAYDGLCTFEFGIAYEVFGLPRPEMEPGWYRFAIAGVEPGPLQAAGGFQVRVDHGLETLRHADLVVVPGWRGIDEAVPGELIRELQEASARGTRLMSLCSGIAVLAAAGVLDGRRATTHWRYIESVRLRFPRIKLVPDVLYVDEGSVLTAAGSAAGIDLCLHVVRKDYGVEAANTVARRLVVPPHREGGQAQSVERPILRDGEGARVGHLIDWIRTHLSEQHTIDGLARNAGMSIRTFQRRFEAVTGLPPGRWITLERLRYARELLERDARVTLEDVAATSGFGSLPAMRHHFRKNLGSSPSVYRERTP
jgi:AraC family transcriptional regulator, transcriptional activator FtrA